MAAPTGWNEVKNYINDYHNNLAYGSKDNWATNRDTFQKVLKELHSKDYKFLVECAQYAIDKTGKQKPNEAACDALMKKIHKIETDMADPNFKSRRADQSIFRSWRRALLNLFGSRTSSSEVVKIIEDLGDPYSTRRLYEMNPTAKALVKYQHQPVGNVQGKLDENFRFANSDINRTAKNSGVDFLSQPTELDLVNKVPPGLTVQVGASRAQLMNSKVVNSQFKSDAEGAWSLCEGGGATCLYLRDNLINEIDKGLDKIDLTNEDAVYNAIYEGFMICNQGWLNSPTRPNDGATDGASVCYVLLTEDTLWVANSGDVRAILVDGTECHQMTDDAIVGTDPRFDELVEDNQGKIAKDGTIETKKWSDQAKEWETTHGSKKVAQGFGNFTTPGITAAPMITRIKLADLKIPSYVVLGTHPIFEAASTNEIGQFVKQSVAAGKDNEATIAAEIVSKAANAKYTDQAYQVNVARIK